MLRLEMGFLFGDNGIVLLYVNKVETSVGVQSSFVAVKMLYHCIICDF